MAPSLANWIKRLTSYRLGGSSIYAMEIPPAWNYQQYLKVYGEVGWLFGANSLISESVADVKWHLYEKDGNQQGDEVDDHPLLDMFAYVNPFQTRYEFIQLTQLYMGLVGEAFWVLNFNSLGVPAEMWLAPPQFMHIIPSAKTYISHYEYRRNVGSLQLEIPEVVHLMSPNPFNPYRGLGPAQSIAVDLDSEKYAARYQNRLFYNDAKPGMLITYEDIPEEAERAKIRAEWNEIHQGWRNALKTGFLWGGAKASTLTLTNKDMEFWRLRKWSPEIIRGAYKLSAAMMGMEGPGSRARVEADEYIFAKYTVKPALTRIKEAINEQLVPLYDEGWMMGFDDPVPENREALVNEAKELYPIGVITREEARINLGYDAEPEGGTFAKPAEPTAAAKAHKHARLVARTFTDEEKAVRWRLYADKAEDEEESAKRLFSKLWYAQMDAVIEAWEQIPDIDQAFNDYLAVETWDREFNPFIAQVFASAYEMATGGGVLAPAHRAIEEPVLSPEALEWIEVRSLALAKMVNGTTKEELRAAIQAGYEAGESIQQLTKRIRFYYQNGYERRAKMVARTEVIAANNEGALQGYEKEGVTKVEFYATLDERNDWPGEPCRDLHGNQYPINESHNMIPVHVNCRCVFIPVVD